jgi:hypothetical protein
MKKWQKLSSELILNTPFFRVRKDEVQLPNGQLKDWV